FHIPFGLDIFTSFKNYFHTMKDFWKTEYSDIFQQEINRFDVSLSAMLLAHVHRDNVQLLISKPLSIPVFYSPSISPIYGNDPEFKIFEYDPNTLKIT